MILSLSGHLHLMLNQLVYQSVGVNWLMGSLGFESLNPQTIHSMRIDIQQLSHHELDMVSLGPIAARYQSNTDRTNFYFSGQHICQTMFLHLHRISRKRLRTLLQHYKKKGIAPGVQQHLQHIKEVVCFILNLTQE